MNLKKLTALTARCRSVNKNAMRSKARFLFKAFPASGALKLGLIVMQTQMLFDVLLRFQSFETYRTRVFYLSRILLTLQLIACFLFHFLRRHLRGFRLLFLFNFLKICPTLISKISEQVSKVDSTCIFFIIRSNIMLII